MKNITILGSTGSIGTQALQVAKSCNYNIIALTAGKNVGLLGQQIEEFKPKYAVVANEEDVKSLQEKYPEVKILWGEAGIETVASLDDNDIVLNSIVGIAGLKGTIAAVKHAKRLALANKESLVCAGSIVMPLAKKYGCEITPVDSEHSAMFQAMQSGKHNEIESVILTASGGPFFGKKAEELTEMKASDALKHPSWSMGNKITIDSATLMNKGFEFIEAIWLFDLKPEQIEVVVHRESIIHSAVEFTDGNVIAQLSNPDMRLPISYAISYPDRVKIPYRKLKLAEIGKMSFYEPDLSTFKCLDLCIRSVERGGNSGAVINGANEEAVKLFLNDKIGFLDIYNCVKYAYDNVKFIENPDIDDIFESDKQARACVNDYIMR